MTSGEAAGRTSRRETEEITCLGQSAHEHLARRLTAETGIQAANSGTRDP